MELPRSKIAYCAPHKRKYFVDSVICPDCWEATKQALVAVVKG